MPGRLGPPAWVMGGNGGNGPLLGRNGGDGPLLGRNGWWNGPLGPPSPGLVLAARSRLVFVSKILGFGIKNVFLNTKIE